MATIAHPPEKKKKKEITLPPKRGQIKARIFEGLFKTIFGRNKEEGSNGSNTSTSSTPPPSAYNSDGNSKIS